MTGISAARTGLALTICALAAVFCPPVDASAAPAPSLRLASAESPDGPNARLVVVVPPLLAMQHVPASAFQVTQAGRTLPVTVRRVVDAGLDVYVLLDTAVAGTTLAAEQSAAADLLRNLPPAVRTATATARSAAGGFSIPSAQPGNAAALRALAAVRPQRTAFLGETLNTIAGMPIGDRRRVIVVLSDCRGPGVRDLGPLVPALGSGDRQLDVVAPGPGCPPQLSSLASGAGGLAMVGGPVTGLRRALATVLFDLLGQYRLSVPVSRDRRPLSVSVAFAGVRVTTDVPLAPAAAPAPATQPGRHPRTLLGGLATVAAIILAATAVIAARTGLLDRTRARSRLLDPTPAPARPAGTAPEAAGAPRAGHPAPEDPGSPDARGTETQDVPARAAPDFPASGLSDRTIRVRLPERADATALMGYAERDGGVADGWLPVPDRGEGVDWAALVDDWVAGWNGRPSSAGLSLVVERCEDGRLVGYLGLRVSPHAVDIVYGTAPSSRGCGYATRALRQVAGWLTEQDAGRPVQVVIPPRHSVGRHVARAAGFYPTGTVRSFVPTTGAPSLDLRFVFTPNDASDVPS